MLGNLEIMVKMINPLVKAKMNLRLANIINTRIGPRHMIYIHPRFEDYDDQPILLVEYWPSRIPVFVKDGDGPPVSEDFQYRYREEHEVIITS